MSQYKDRTCPKCFHHCILVPAERDFPVSAGPGDAGGAVAIPVEDSSKPIKWYLGGIISWGASCRPYELNNYNVHSNVSTAIDWIVETVQYIIQ